jgi:hypothetical protein
MSGQSDETDPEAEVDSWRALSCSASVPIASRPLRQDKMG